MIVAYDQKYNDDIKSLLGELQEYIASIDKEGYNFISDGYEEKYLKQTLEEVEEYAGKIFLWDEDGRIVGLVVALINNDEEDDLGFRAPKRGRISELIVSKECRGKKIGFNLLKKMEEYLYSVGCEDILIGVFAYNERAMNFYEQNGYHTRMIEVTKKINRSED